MTLEVFIADRRSTGFLSATSLSVIKPWLRTVLRRPVRLLFDAGIVANQVTLFSIAGSVAIGTLLAGARDVPSLFLVMPVWLTVRTALASIDGALAIDFGQKSRLGGYLNEVGDIVSEIALWAPLLVVAPMKAHWILVIVALAMLAEFAGALGPLLGGPRRVEGPLGKADRSIVLGIIGVCIAITGTLPAAMADFGLPLVAALLVLTIVNRLRLACRDAQDPSPGRDAP